MSLVTEKSHGNALASPDTTELNNWIFESSPDCVKVLDLDGHLLAMNGNGQCAMEIDNFNDVCNAPWASLWPAESTENIQHALETARSGKVGHFNAFCPTAKGTPKWWDVMVTPILDKNGRIERLLSVSRDVTAVYQAEEASREGIARLQFTLEAAQVGEWDLDLVTDTARRSLRHDQCFGYTEPVAKWGFHIFMEHVHPADREKVRHAFDTAVRQHTNWKVECRVLWPDGSTHWVLVHGSIYSACSGKPTRMLGIIADITERKRADILAQGQKTALEMAVDGVPLPDILKVLIRSAEEHTGGMVMASVLLLDADGKHLRMAAAPSLPTAYNKAIDGVAIGPSAGSCGTAAFSGEMVIARDIANDPRWEHFRGLALAHGLRACWSQPILSSQGRVLGTLASYYRSPHEPTRAEQESMALLVNTAALILDRRHEIEERHAAEQALQKSEQRFRSLLMATAHIVWTTEANGRMVEDSASWRAFTGQDKDESFGIGWLAAIHPDDRDRTAHAWAESVAKRRIFETEYRLCRADGAYRWTAVRAVPILNPDGSLREWVGANTDITERKEAEEALRRLANELAEANQRKTEFLATLAHELRNPLAPIRNGLEVIRLSGNVAPAAKIREMMERQVAHMVHLIDDLLDVARITRGKLELKKGPVELKSIIASAVETSMPLIEAGNHDLVVDISEEALLLEADATRVAQVVSNLVNNAAKYTPAGGRITLAVKREGSEALISVMDTGVGIPVEVLPTVFDMFVQVGQSKDRAQGGLGIGLTLVRRLVELHGGTVTAASAGLGTGCTFCVRLPLMPARPADALPRGDSATEIVDAAQGFRVLVVDDNVDAAASLSSLLELMGHTTCIAHDGHQALRMAEEFRPQVAFLDIGLPDMDGYQVARTLRTKAASAQAVLVALTGWGAESDRALSQQAGFDHHLTKPASLDAISGLLADLARAGTLAQA